MSTPPDAPTSPHDTQDLADQTFRAQQAAEEKKKMCALLADRQKRLPPPWFLKTLGVFAGLTMLGWIFVFTVVAATTGPSVGRPVAIGLAVSATLTVSTAIMVGVGMLMYVINGRVAEWDRIAEWRHAEITGKFDDLSRRLGRLERVLSESTVTPDRQKAWDNLAGYLRNGPPEGVIPMVEGRPPRNRSSS